MRTISSILITMALVIALPPVAALGQQRPEPLTNASVIKLVHAAFKEKTVIAIIRSRTNRFDLTPESLIELKHKGVSENIILAMLAQNGADLSREDDWSDDAFFKRGDRPASAEKERGNENNASIFGSGGSAQSQVRDRGGNGSSEGDTQTTGSATVRILRPPVEQANVPLKLERIPTLNNDSVIDLVEAGFSEGTIVKRIQQSPVEFDLSPAKLAALRKHRVSEAIITAMSAAMRAGV